MKLAHISEAVHCKKYHILNIFEKKNTTTTTTTTTTTNQVKEYFSIS
jgi:hypothetical protein